ncbi:MAG: low molecular weight protein arginine phosphatase [Candidatus Omnitrophica bacterium]|nr:low molecular weight protein arginine phosphatase [Candidatus Omnitrophota bacterium]
MKDIRKILFVCTGNSCRSIMAEAYMRKRVSEEGLPVEVRSAGTMGINGMSPSPQAVKVLSDEGMDAEDLKSTGLTRDLIEWADLILVMEPMHKVRILEEVPEAEGRVQYLATFDPDKNDVVIPDPIGRPVAFYRTSFSLIKGAIEELMKWLKK